MLSRRITIGYKILVCTSLAIWWLERFLIYSNKQERKKVAKASCEESTTSTAVGLPEPTIQEEFRRLKVVKSGGKVRHVDVAVVKDAGVISILTANNQVIF